MKAKKSYGQHFLNNERIAANIAESLNLPDDCKTVVEIGPGQGFLTKYLLKGDYELHLVEADRDMVSHINRHYPEVSERLISEDVLKVNFPKRFSGQYAVIGNFPYNISSQIVFLILDNKEQIPQMVGMFQKEVAERICAKSGSRTYGIISVLVQAYYDANYLFEVTRENFSPPPKVQSAVIELVRKKELEISCNPKLFKRVVKTAFSQRRKMLRNTIKSIVPDSDLLKEERMQKRAEHLTVADFIQLTNDIAQELEKDLKKEN